MNKALKRLNHKPMLAFACLSLLIPLLVKNRYYQDIMVLAFLYAGTGTAWNIYSGSCNRLSLGHAAFFGLGAYGSAILYTKCGISPWLGMLAGVALSLIAAGILGNTTLKLRGIYFTLTTQAFCGILRILAANLKGLTGGNEGVLIPYAPGFQNMMWSGKTPYAILMWAYMMLCIILAVVIERTKFGYSMVALGQNREAAESLGVNTKRTMVSSYLLSAALTAIGGALFAFYQGFFEPDTVLADSVSVNIIMICIIGGTGTAMGPLIGSFILTPLQNMLRGWFSSVSGLHGFVLGLVLIIMLLIKPDGLYPQFHKLYERITAKLGASDQKGGGLK